MNILTNKSYKDYSYVSRYSMFPYYYHTVDNKYIYSITANLKTDTIYTVHTIKVGDTLDNLALYYYNNPTLYWIICSFNNIKDPFKSLTPGQQLKIPSISNIEFDLEGRR